MSHKTIVWEDLYTDLGTRIANTLRTARVKPEQLSTMSDGEITALPGIGEVALEEIRAKYTLSLEKKSTPKSTPKVATESTEPTESTENTESTDTPRRPRHINQGGKKIKASKSKVDRKNLYTPEDAIKLIKNTNITSFDATLTLHLNLIERVSRVEVTFPHMAGAKKKIAIASDAVIAEIEKGKFNFDILLATPAMMPRLAKHARVLGPKGLMPSPKAGTVTPDPEAKKAEFAGGKTMLKGEGKFPLMHIVLGKLSQPDKELVANLDTVLEAVKVNKITKATLASTMSPGVKLLLS